LKQKLLVQGERLPPTAAVHGPCQNGYYQAQKGKFTFKFRFDIPSNSPASFEFQNLAKLQYILAFYVKYKFNGSQNILFKRKPINIIDRWNPMTELKLKEPIVAENCKKLIFGGDLPVLLNVRLESCALIAGSTIRVFINVQNRSKKRVPVY
jgi:hypothetical protein